MLPRDFRSRWRGLSWGRVGTRRGSNEWAFYRRWQMPPNQSRTPEISSRKRTAACCSLHLFLPLPVSSLSLFFLFFFFFFCVVDAVILPVLHCASARGRAVLVIFSCSCGQRRLLRYMYCVFLCNILFNVISLSRSCHTGPWQMRDVDNVIFCGTLG